MNESKYKEKPLERADYAEPCCPFAKPNSPSPIPLPRVIGKLDEYLGKNDMAAAERHLAYWLAEAEADGDDRGRLTILNEQIGLFRKTEQEAKATAAAEEALALAESLGYAGTVTMGTTLINAATAYRAFGQTEKALPCYERARALYESLLPANDERLGGLYNNMALTVTALGRYDEACALYEKALAVMAGVEHGEADRAITYCNMADLAAARDGEEAAEAEIGCCLDRALELLDTPTLPRNGYYAYVCEKCAPTFGYYGYFAAEAELMKRRNTIYERS